MAISGKSNTEYYNLEKVAEVLNVPTAEVNRLREQSKLRGFRDGSNWKFNKEEVHTYLAESIRSRGGNGRTSGGHNPGDSGFDLAGESASASSFDLLVEEAALPADDQLISASPVHPRSDLDLAALDRDDELSLAEETQISSLVVPKKAKTPATESKSEAMDVTAKEDSSALVLASDDSSVLGAASSSPQLGLAGDSGFDVLVAGETGDESEVLLVDESTETATPPIVEFELEPSPSMPGDDDSESSSQVIAIDVGLAGDAMGTDAFDSDGFENFIDFGSGVQDSPAPAAGDPFGTGGSSFSDATSLVTVSPAKTVVKGEEYSTGMLVALILALVVMLLPGLMFIDTMVHLWSWGEPSVINGLFMSTIAGWFGLGG